MNRETLIKIAVGAVGLYIVYLFARSRGWIGETPTGPVALPVPNPNQHTAVLPPAPVSVIPTAQQQQTGRTDEIASQTDAAKLDPLAAARDVAYAASSPLRFTPDEWNYYRQQIQLPIRDAAEYPGVTADNRGSFRISGADYHAWLSGGGMSGIRTATGVGSSPLANFWGGWGGRIQ